MVIWLIGLSGSGKTTIGNCVYKQLKKKIKNIVYIDGDIFRKIMSNDLGYSLKDRNKNAIRIINLVSNLAKQDLNVICASNLTSSKSRNIARKKIKDYYEVFINVSINKIIKERDYKNLYKLAIKKKIKNVTGVDIKYIIPKKSNLVIDNEINKKKILTIANKIILNSNIL